MVSYGTAAPLMSGRLPVKVVQANQYVAVAAGQTAAPFKTSAGNVGDLLVGVLVIPATTSPGAVTIYDDSTAIVSWPGGASSVPNLIPFFIPIEALSQNAGGWNVTTGSNVSVVGIGLFS